MGAEIPGRLSILFALSTCLLSGLAWVLVARGKRNFESLAKHSYHMFTASLLFAMVYLFYLFFSHNYAFKYVYEYSERTQPFLYILSGFWGGQEGTYLLWAVLSALLGYVVLRRAGAYRNWAMTVYCLVNLFFLFILTRLSPFALRDVPSSDGLGLNPLLRDPWMVVHPPIMFIGYAAAAVPFAIAMAALIKNDYSRWAQKVFPWVAVTALMLAAGNILGGYWAYKTLGWGGYWGWDPVENSSFIPWMISLALLHGLIIERRSGALRKTNLLLTAFVFLLVVYGTFLTRSGVLADFSVHSFTDLGVNVFLIGFMIAFVVLTVALFAFRARSIPAVPMDYNLFGKTFSLFSGMVMLFLLGVVILFWTSLPLLSGWFTDHPRAADIATYNGFALPMAIIFGFLLSLSPLLTFTKRHIDHAKRRTLVSILVATISSVAAAFGSGGDMILAVLIWLIVAGSAMFWWQREIRMAWWPAAFAFVAAVGLAYAFGVRTPLYLLFFGVASMAVISNAIAVMKHIPARWQSAGGLIAHLGFGLMLVGILASSALSTNEKLILPRGDSGTAYGLQVSYRGMKHAFDYPNNELILDLTSQGSTREIYPQLYYSKRMDGLMRKPFIRRSFLQDLYFAPEQIQSLNAGPEFTLTKGESREVGGYDFIFKGYRMSEHEHADSGLTVFAELAVDYNGKEYSLSPALKQVIDASGQPRVEQVNAVLPAPDAQYAVSIQHILADQGAVVLSIPGLVQDGPQDRLILDVSRKPLIMLVWIGTTLILLGSLVVFIRRRREALEAASYTEAL